MIIYFSNTYVKNKLTNLRAFFNVVIEVAIFFKQNDFPNIYR